MKKLFLKVLIVFGFLVQSVFADITTGLVAHYPFEGNTNDSSTNSYNGTTTGSLTYATGQVGQSAIFNGNSSIELPSDVNLSNQSFTISGWFKPNNVTDGMWIMSQGTVAGEYKYLQLNIYNKNFQVDFFNHSASSTGTATTPNQWYYYTVTFDNTTKIATIYLNGVQSGSANMGGSFTGTTPFRIGLYNSTHFYTGEIDEIKIYNRTLSSSDVTALYQATIPPDITSNLIAHYEFEGNANDSSGNSYNSTYSNFTSGKFGQSASFNGTTQFLKIDSIAGHLPSGNSARTVSMWVKPNSILSNTAMLSWGTYNVEKARFSVENFSGAVGVAPQLSGGDFVSSASLDTTNWQHITVVYSGSNSIDFYKNGAFVQTVTKNALDTNGTFPLIIGASADGNSGIAEWFNGQIDEVRIYDRALTGSDVTALYNYTPTPKLTLKAHGGVVQLDGSKDYLLLPAITEIATNHAFTIESLVNLASDGDRFHHIFRQNGDIEYALRFDTNDNQLAFYIRDTNENGGAVTYNLTEDLQEFKDSWHHIAATFDANNLKLYVDGVQKASMAHNLSSLPSISGDAFIGATNQNATDNERFNGLIDEVRIWNTARTQSEIQSNLNQQLDGNETGLVAYYNFDERVGNVVKDITANDKDGTIAGNVKRLNFLGDTLHFSSVNNDSVAFPSGMYRPTQAQGLTIGAWSKIQDGQNWHTLFRQNGTGIQYSLRYHTDSDYLDFYINYTDSNGTSVWKSLTHSLEGNANFLNQWHYAAVTLDNSSIKLYYDGVEVNSTSVSMDISNSGTLSEAVIGTDYSVNSTAPSNHLLGDVAEVSIWNRPLTVSEIQHLMTSAPNLADTNLVAYYPLNEGSGTIAYDRKGANNGTITGTTWTNTAPTLYGDTLYTDYGINSWQKLVVENNNTTPTYSLTNSGISNLNSTSGLFLYSSQIGNTTLNATSSNPNLALNIGVLSLRDVFSAGTGTTNDDVFTNLSNGATIDGGDGNDTLVLSGNKATYTIIKNGASYTVTNGTNSYFVSNIEYISFNDIQNVAINDALSPKLTLKAHGGAVQFDGTSGYITANSPTTQTDDITMEAWVNWGGSTGSNQYILVNGTGLSNGYGVMVNTDNELRIALSNVTVLNPSVTLTPNEWHHIALTRTNSTWQFYYDGVMTNMTNATYTDATPTDGLKIGANSSGANKFKGIIDEVRVWNIAKTNTQIQTNMNQQLDGNESGLVAYYNFDERVGTKVKDRSVNRYDGTITGNVRRLNFLDNTVDLGTGTYITTANNTSLSSFSVGGWFKADKTKTGDYLGLVTMANSGSGMFQLSYMSSGNVVFELFKDNSSPQIGYATSDVNIKDGGWHFAALTYDNSLKTANLYVDGVLKTTQTNAAMPTTLALNSKINIGADRYIGTASLLDGASNIWVYNRSLSQAEIETVMAGTPNISDTSLVGYWPINEGTGTTIKDYSSSNNNGNITGSTYSWTNTAPTLYGDTLYTDYGINSWQKLVVENNNTTPTYSLTNSGISNLNSTSGLFLYSSQIGNTTLNATSSNPNLSLDIDVKSNTSVIIGSGNGTSEDDLFVDTNGNDIFNGLTGNDTVIFTGNKTSYTVTKNNDGNFSVVGPNGTDTLINIEYVSFDDGQNIVINSLVKILPSFTTISGTQAVVNQPYKYYIGMKIGSEPSYTLSASGLPSGITLLDVNNTAIVSTYTGKGLNTNVDGTLATSTFQNPQALTTLSDGTIFVVGANKVRKIDINGTVSTFAGTSSTGSTDGAGTSATFNGAYDIASDSSGNLYIADGENNKIRKITPDGTVSTFAGSGTIGSADGTGITATFSRPIGVAVDANGNIFVADTNNNKIRKITPAGVVTTFAGSGTASSVDGTGISATFNKPEKLTFDKNGDLYVADTTGHKIRKITPAGVVTTIAGSGTAGSTDGTGTSATFKYPKGIITDSAGNLYIGDCDNHKIREITPNGVVTTIAGQATYKDRDGINTVAGFNFPIGLTFDKDGNLLVADNNNHKIKKIVLANYMLSGTPTNTGESNITLTATSGTMSTSQNFTLDIVSSSLTVGLLAQYSFDSTITDGSRNGYNLTVSGTPAYVSDRNGFTSSAYSLTAGSNRLTYQFANDSNYIRTQDNIGTVAFWMKASPQTSGASIISMYTGGAENGSFEIYTNATKKLLISPANYGIEGTTTDVGAFDNNWHHIAVVYNGTSKSIYLDGQSVDINNSNYTYNVGPSIMIGHENTASPFTGAVDDIKIYNRALSSAEIALLTEIVFGTSSNDNLSGTTSNDRFVGSDGNDTINGSDGNDTVVYDGNRTSYTVTKNSDGSYTVVKPNSGGTDTLINIEYLSFSDVQNIELQSFNVISSFGNNWLKSSSTPITPAQIGLNFALTGSSQNTILTKIDTNNFVGIQAKIKPIAFGGTASFSMTIDNIITLEIFEKEIKISQTNNNIFDLDNTVSFKDKILYGNIWLSNGKIYANVTDEYQNQIGRIVQMDTNLSSFQNAQFQAKSGNQAFLSVDLQNVSMYETPLMNQVKRLDFLTTQIPASTYEGATEIDSTNVAMYKVATVEDTNHYINKSVTQILKKDGKTYSSNVVLNHKNQLVTDVKTIESGIERKYIEELSASLLATKFRDNNITIEFSSDAKGYKVYEKNQAGAINETYLLNKTALKELFTNLQMVQYPTKPVTISTLWTYLALPTDINLCIGSYKTSLVDICDQNTTIEAVFGTIDTVYKHQGFWSYWANNKNYSFDKIGLLSSKDGLLVKSEYARTINLPYDITKEISTNLIDFYQKGWYLVHIPFEMSLDEIDTKITAQNKTLKYIFRFKNNTWDIYAPQNDNNFPSNITRIQKLNSGDIVWIEVE